MTKIDIICGFLGAGKTTLIKRLLADALKGEQVGLIEKEHEARYLKLLANVEKGEVFAKSEKVVWQCSNCGHIVVGRQAPEVCPVCAHPKAYFELKADNY
mgnify:CR=1 FL=1